MRIIRTTIGLVLVEAALGVIGYMAPAMRALLRPVYIVVAAAFVVALWHAARTRTGHDRRHEERRHG